MASESADLPTFAVKPFDYLVDAVNLVRDLTPERAEATIREVQDSDSVYAAGLCHGLAGLAYERGDIVTEINWSHREASNWRKAGEPERAAGAVSRILVGPNADDFDVMQIELIKALIQLSHALWEMKEYWKSGLAAANALSVIYAGYGNPTWVTVAAPLAFNGACADGQPDSAQVVIDELRRFQAHQQIQEVDAMIAEFERFLAELNQGLDRS